jgi:hypothetical protein
MAILQPLERAFQSHINLLNQSSFALKIYQKDKV